MFPKVIEISSRYRFSTVFWILNFCIFVFILVIALAKETPELEVRSMGESNRPIKM